MTTTPSPAWPDAGSWPAPPTWPAPPRKTTRTGRVLALVLGSLLLLPGLLVLGGGGTLLWAHYLDRSDGYVVSPQDSFSTWGYALVSDRIDLSAVPSWLPVPTTVGTARLEVTGAGSDDVFVGIAPAADARAYLEGVQRTVVTGLGFGGPPSYRDQLRGGGPSGLPSDQDFWITQASGSGTQKVTWKPADGDWMFVVMNADGSQRVEVGARIGARIPALGWLGWGAVVVGSALTFVAVRLLVGGLRRPWIPAEQYRQPTGTWTPRRSTVDGATGDPADPRPESTIPER
jgi:hypothetical protein